MTANLFVIANVKKLRTGGGFRILLPFFRTSWGVGVLNSAIFTIGLSLERFWGAFGISVGGGLTPHPRGTPLYQSETSCGDYLCALHCFRLTPPRTQLLNNDVTRSSDIPVAFLIV